MLRRVLGSWSCMVLPTFGYAMMFPEIESSLNDQPNELRRDAARIAAPAATPAAGHPNRHSGHLGSIVRRTSASMELPRIPCQAVEPAAINLHGSPYCD
jgi:hypothetical protein